MMNEPSNLCEFEIMERMRQNSYSFLVIGDGFSLPYSMKQLVNKQLISKSFLLRVQFDKRTYFNIVMRRFLKYRLRDMTDINRMAQHLTHKYGFGFRYKYIENGEFSSPYEFYYSISWWKEKLARPLPAKLHEMKEEVKEQFCWIADKSDHNTPLEIMNRELEFCEKPSWERATIEPLIEYDYKDTYLKEGDYTELLNCDCCGRYIGESKVRYSLLAGECFYSCCRCDVKIKKLSKIEKECRENKTLINKLDRERLKWQKLQQQVT